MKIKLYSKGFVNGMEILSERCEVRTKYDKIKIILNGKFYEFPQLKTIKEIDKCGKTLDFSFNIKSLDKTDKDRLNHGARQLFISSELSEYIDIGTLYSKICFYKALKINIFTKNTIVHRNSLIQNLLWFVLGAIISFTTTYVSMK